jgi:hypothetical protein
VISPNCVPIHVHNGKIEERIDRFRLSGMKQDLPIEMQSIGIEQTQGAIEFVVMDCWQQFL